MMIGVVAGAGPYAGLDLVGKILAQTIANRDQEHLPILSLSQPAELADRTAFLLGQGGINPAYAIARQVLRLEAMGATVAAIPCNTAHAAAIYDVARAELAAAGSHIPFLHMIDEVRRFISRTYPHVERVGVLATTGTIESGVYTQALAPAGFTVLAPPAAVQAAQVHPAIYDLDYGIKACGRATPQARQQLLHGAAALRQAGAQAIVLGCTEIPLAIDETRLGDAVVVDATLVLARALVAHVDPTKLREWESGD